MLSDTNKNFPPQRLPLTQKGKEWGKRHLDWAEGVKYAHGSKIRKSLITKKINFDLYAGHLSISDMKLYLNPYNKVSNYIPTKVQHYPVMNQPLDLLAGEEVNRKHELTVKVANPEAISELEEQKALEIRNRLLEYASKEIQEGQEEAEAKDLLKYLNYNYQDLREVQANYILNDAIKNVNFFTKLNQGFKHVEIVAEEIYIFDVVGGEYIMEVLNPKKVYNFRSGNSSRIEDSDIIIVDDYWSYGRIVDTFHGKLTKEDLRKLDKLVENSVSGNGDNIWIDETRGFLTLPSDNLPENVLDGYLGYANEMGLPHADYTDSDGNIRVLKVFWKSQKKIFKLKRYDEITGDVIEEYVSELYKPIKELGEEVETHWINEWWEGTKIGNEVYIDIRPKEFQFRKRSNPSLCHPGIVGQIYNINQLKPQSLVDKMKPMQYLFDAVMDRLIKTVSNHVGKVGEIDLAKMAWDDVDKFLHFVRTEQLAFQNSFKESNKGVAAGQYNTVGGKTIDLDQSDSISMYMNLLEYIRKTLYDMVGITPQRLGEITNRETVGGIERSVTQSSHITAEIFAIHDDVIKRCAEVLLETAKFALRGNKIKAQYVTSDGISMLLDIDGDDFSETDHGIYVENEIDLNGLRQKLEGLAQAWSQQSDIVRPSTILSIFEDKSISSIKRKLLNDEEEKMKRDQETAKRNEAMAQQQNQILAEKQKQDLDLKKLELQLKDLENQRDNSTKLQIALLSSQTQEGTDNSAEIEKLQLQKEKLDREIALKQEQFNKTMDETIRHNKVTEEISRQNKRNNKTS